MNIIWITTQFPNGINNKNGMFNFRTVNNLSDQYSITVINLYPIIPPFLPMIKNIFHAKNIFNSWKKRYPKNPKAPLGLKTKIIYAKYIRLPRGRFHYLEGLFSYLSIKHHLKNLVHHEDTLIHATWLFPEGDLANIIFKKHQTPFLVTLMGSDVHFLNENTPKWDKAKDIISNAKYVTSVSKELYTALENKKLNVPQKKQYLTHTIYEFDFFFIKDRKNLREEYNLSQTQKIIFYAGTLRKLKNVNYLIESIKLLKGSNLSLKLLIAGIGEEEGNLKQLVKKYSLENNISFLGGLTGNIIVDYYNIADVFCLPSKNEGLPNVIIESLLCGTPVVASAVGEIPHIIKNDKNGFVVNPNDVEDLSQKIEKSLRTKWNREILRNSVSFLSPQKVLEEYKTVYTNIEKEIK